MDESAPLTSSVPQGAASETGSATVAGRLRRDLGTLESYAALLGILIGAGIFTVTSRAWSLTGPSVILGYVVLFPLILATSVPYAAFLSTPPPISPCKPAKPSRKSSLQPFARRLAA